MGTWVVRRPWMTSWVMACAVAETIGMTASAAAARLGQQVSDGGGGRWSTLGVVVGGGLIEGVALGSLQAGVLGRRWSSLNRRRFLLVTVAVAGIGWAAASAPGVLAGDDGAGAGPPLLLVVLGAVGLGLVMGAVLGAAQARALAGVVRHPRRWMAANAAAWPLAMAVIFTGATTAGAGWPVLVVAGYGALTGAVGGVVLGLVSGCWLGSLDGQSVANRVVLALLESGRLDTGTGMVAFAVRGRRTGRVVRFPVQYAVWGDDLVVVPGHADRKSWWRNVEGAGVPVEVLWQGTWRPTTARLIAAGDTGYEPAMAAYRLRWRHAGPSIWEPVVVLQGVGSGIPASRRGLESVR